MKRLPLLIVLLVLGGCGILGFGMLDRLYGPEDPGRFDRRQTRLTEGQTVDFRQQVKPILDSRCVACHACYDAPCQLQLGSYEGITRGANRERVYNATRLFAARPTRLFFDADNNREWRQRGFFPVLNERKQDDSTNLSASIMAQVLALKQAVPGPVEGLLPDRSFDFSLDRQEVCPTLEGWSDYRQRHPEWGMPFGLPPLTSAESATLLRWLEQGAPPSPVLSANPKTEARVAAMEAFLNGKSLKEQLMARYLFEHWFLAHLYFEEDRDKTFFELVRSATPPGQPIRVIASRRPYDDPGVPIVYYRLRPVPSTLVAKTHMPYALGSDRLRRIREWFLEDPYPVTALPGYDPEKSANPFITFRDIPVRSRYRLLLEDAQFTVMGFIKGPSCRGQTALNVIDDHFWVSFVHPDIPQIRNSSEFLSEALTRISLPTAQQSNALFSPWLIYSRQQNEYLQRKAAYVNKLLTGAWRPTLNELWDGDGHNRNAALTIFRHFDSASVEKGLLGGHPQKALIVGFEVLERIHYLLVAGFDVYGNLPHQLQARLYMDFLRMEGEQNVLTLLPQAARKPVRDHWYRNASAEVLAYLNGTRNYFNPDSGITYHTNDPLAELYDAWVGQLGPVLDHSHDLSPSETGKTPLEWLNRLAGIRGQALQNLPENSLVTLIKPDGKEQVFTLIRNSAHSNIAGLFNESDRRLPDEDTLYVARGFIGAYPNVMYRVAENQLGDFVSGVQHLASPADYTKFAERFAVRRTQPDFWQHYDRVTATYRANAPIEAGVLDLSRYENR
jgi:hypothetical protein